MRKPDSTIRKKLLAYGGTAGVAVALVAGSMSAVQAQPAVSTTLTTNSPVSATNAKVSASLKGSVQVSIKANIKGSVFFLLPADQATENQYEGQMLNMKKNRKAVTFKNLPAGKYVLAAASGESRPQYFNGKKKDTSANIITVKQNKRTKVSYTKFVKGSKYKSIEARRLKNNKVRMTAQIRYSTGAKAKGKVKMKVVQHYTQNGKNKKKTVLNKTVSLKKGTVKQTFKQHSGKNIWHNKFTTTVKYQGQKNKKKQFKTLPFTYKFTHK